MAKFHVSDSFTIARRRLFVLAGSIVEGEVLPGMAVCLPFNRGMTLTTRIHAVEVARRLGGRKQLCLCIRCSGTDELAHWRGLNLVGKTLNIEVDG